MRVAECVTVAGNIYIFSRYEYGHRRSQHIDFFVQTHDRDMQFRFNTGLNWQLRDPAFPGITSPASAETFTIEALLHASKSSQILTFIRSHIHGLRFWDLHLAADRYRRPPLHSPISVHHLMESTIDELMEASDSDEECIFQQCLI